MNARARRFPLFDSLRAIAAIVVLCSHAAGYAGADLDGTSAQPFAARLNVGVTIFFVISGFLLYRPFSRARVLGKPRPDLRAYALGRFLRIAPAYWVALTIIALWLPRPFVLSGKWWQFYGFGQIYAGAPLGGISAAWSLCVEAAFYVFLPFFALAVARFRGGDVRTRLRGEMIGLGLLVIAAIGFRGLIVAEGSKPGSALDVAPFEFLDWFALGMLLAVLTVWLETRGTEALPRWLRPFDRFPGIAWAAALVLFVADALYFNGKIVNYTTFENYLEHLMYGLIAFAVVAPFTFGDQRRGWIRRALDNRVLLYLGLISYGIFLWHQAVLEQLGRWHLERVTFIHPYLLWPGTALLITAAIATVSYYVVERPSMSLRRRLIGPRAERQREEATGEPTPAAPVVLADS